MRLDGNAALITGAASGIGRGIAQRFLEAGAAVAIFDIDGERARETARELSALGRVLAIEGDVSDESHAESAVRQTAAEFGGLDILINNAAIETVGTVEAMSAVEWDRLLAVNLKGCFLFARHSIPVMRPAGRSDRQHLFRACVYFLSRNTGLRCIEGCDAGPDPHNGARPWQGRYPRQRDLSRLH